MLGVRYISQIEKLIVKIRSKPIRNDITYSEFVSYLEYYGFQDNSTGGSSHMKFKYDNGGIFLQIFFKKPHGNSDGIEEPYIRKANTTIDQLIYLLSRNG